jgi:cyclase
MKNRKLCYYFVILNFCFLSFSNWSFSQNLTNNSTGILKVSEGIFLLNNYGCNIAVMVGQEGLLIIDTGYEGTSSKVDSVISSISNLQVKYILNTHQHFDHVGGNKKLFEKGAVIVANENTRKIMLSGWKVPEIQGAKFPTILPYTTEYLPKICFKDSLKIFFNNDIVQAIHYPNAHSDCDVIYYFLKANVMHTGDLFFSNGFPIIDIYYGGTIDGLIKAIDNILKICDDQTIIIPGHGAISNRQGLKDYREMLIESKVRIVNLVKEGKTEQEVVEADPTKGLFKRGKSWLAPSVFVSVVYQELARK